MSASFKQTKQHSVVKLLVKWIDGKKTNSIGIAKQNFDHIDVFSLKFLKALTNFPSFQVSVFPRLNIKLFHFLREQVENLHGNVQLYN